MVTPLGMLREFSLKLLTTGFQRFDFRDAIDFHLSVKVEDSSCLLAQCTTVETLLTFWYSSRRGRICRQVAWDLDSLDWPRY